MSRVAPLVVLLFLLPASLARAAERHVPADHASVAAALDAAQAGDEIVVAAGAFLLATTRAGMIVTIRGAGRDLTFLDGAAPTCSSSSTRRSSCARSPCETATTA